MSHYVEVRGNSLICDCGWYYHVGRRTLATVILGLREHFGEVYKNVIQAKTGSDTGR